MQALIFACLGLLLALPAQAQLIDCGAGCSETLYGLGNDPSEGPYLNTYGTSGSGPGDGSCSVRLQLRHQGQLSIRDQDSCTVSATTRCRVEIPQGTLTSGFIRASRGDFDLGPLGLLGGLGGLYLGLEGNVGHRELSGTCTLDAGEECALDSDCPSQAGCLSTCFSDPGTSCSTESDAACPVANDCRTEIEWDGIGTCTDDATLCTSDADCAGAPDFCEAGIEISPDPAGCTCCQSSLGTVCPILGFAEYPALSCPDTAFETERVHVNSPDWLFDGGRGARFEMAEIQVPGQVESMCGLNSSRPCGPRGDRWAGAANGKCANTSPNVGVCPDPFDAANPALESSCDDVAWGGTAGDFCDLVENGTRVGDGALNPDGTQNNTVCAGWTHIVGNPGELCGLPDDIPDGDPQPGCRIFNIGVVASPDLDCNGIVDTVEGRCTPVGGVICSDPAQCPACATDADCASGSCINGGDLCPFLGELNWFLDSNDEGIGDECQCGDATGDGAVTGLDIGATALCANGAVLCDSTIADTDGDGTTTSLDIGGIVAAVNGTIQLSDLTCVVNSGPTP